MTFVVLRHITILRFLHGNLLPYRRQYQNWVAGFECIVHFAEDEPFVELVVAEAAKGETAAEDDYGGESCGGCFEHFGGERLRLFAIVVSLAPVASRTSAVPRWSAAGVMELFQAWQVSVRLVR